MRVIEKADIAPLEPLLCSIKAGCAILGVSNRFIIDAIVCGKITRTCLAPPEISAQLRAHYVLLRFAAQRFGLEVANVHEFPDP